MISRVDLQSLAELRLPAQTTPGLLLSRQKTLAVRQAAYAASHSRFYERRFPQGISTFDQIPCMDAGVWSDPELLWCLPARKIARIVTLHSSGSTGMPKRVAFSESDIARTVAFFCAGMSDIVRTGDSVLCLLPGSAPFGVTDQLRQALQMIGVRCDSQYSPSASSPPPRYDCVVGMPQQTLRFLTESGQRPRCVLLSADYVPQSLAKRLHDQFGAAVFTHYGMTEFCYGGAVTCPEQDGQHIRHADLLFEILHPQTQQPVPPGSVGEIVVTTLRREATPLLRYRTGDAGILCVSPCKCGGLLPRLHCVYGRLQGLRPIGRGYLSIQLLDEILFSEQLAPELLDYRAVLRQNRLTLFIDGPKLPEDSVTSRIFQTCGAEFPILYQYVRLEPSLQKRRLFAEP